VYGAGDDDVPTTGCQAPVALDNKKVASQFQQLALITASTIKKIEIFGTRGISAIFALRSFTVALSRRTRKDC